VYDVEKRLQDTVLGSVIEGNICMYLEEGLRLSERTIGCMSHPTRDRRDISSLIKLTREYDIKTY
jgi:hypothetical protein